MIIINIFILMV